MTASTWWRPRRVAVAIAVALLVALIAFVYRFNTLGGARGGFDNDHFVHLLRADMLLSGEQPLRDFADAELRGAWPSLGYELSAWAQRLWGRNLLAEAYLTVGALALAAAIAFLVAVDLSRRWSVALLAVACIIAAGPKLYNYEKVVVLVVAIALVRLWCLKPTITRVALLAVWTVAAGLIRHDYGVYVGVASIVAIVVRHMGRRPVVRDVGAYVGIAVVLLLPSLIWIQTYQGIGSYIQVTLASVRGESSRTALITPTFDLSAGVDESNLLALTYYAFWAVVLVTGLAFAWRLIKDRLKAADVATVSALLALAALVNAFFLRGNIGARFGDAIVPVAMLGAAAAALAPPLDGRPRLGAFAAWAAPALLVAIVMSVFVTVDIRAELATGGLSHSLENTTRRFQSTRAELRSLPPARWSADVKTPGTLVAARYLAECTAPSDRVLVVTYAPEVPVFARRLFAAGQGTFGLTFYESDAQQDEAVARLRLQSVPIVLGAYEDFEGDFVQDYSRVAAYLASRYRDAGVIDVDDEPRFRVLVDNGRTPTGVDPHLGLPCFR